MGVFIGSEEKWWLMNIYDGNKCSGVGMDNKGSYGGLRMEENGIGSGKRGKMGGKPSH